MDNKLREKIIKNIEWTRSTQEGWQGSFILPDGYRISVVSAPGAAMRPSKSLIKEILPERVYEVAIERNVAIFNK